MTENGHEEAKALFSLYEPPRKLFRMDGGDTRWYYSPTTDRFYPSVTSVIKSTMPTPYGLIQWMMKHGAESEEIRDERAAYGTWLHIQLGELLINGSYDLDALPKSISAYAKEEGLIDVDWYDGAKQDILAFAQFVQDHNVRPLAVEIMLSSNRGFAGAVDLVCEMSIGSGANCNFLKKDGDGERITAIIDVKSGRKGFYESHEIQLAMYRDMWEENFPEIPIQKMFNWSPKNWRSSPTYTLKDQTDSPSQEKIPHLIRLFELSGHEPKPKLVVFGTITTESKLSQHYTFESVMDKMRG